MSMYVNNVFQFIESLTLDPFYEINYKGKEEEFFVGVDLLPDCPAKVVGLVYLYSVGIYVEKSKDKVKEIILDALKRFPKSKAVLNLAIDINDDFCSTSLLDGNKWMSKEEVKKLYELREKTFPNNEYVAESINLEFYPLFEAPKDYEHADLLTDVLEKYSRIRREIEEKLENFFSLTNLDKLEEAYDAFYVAIKDNIGYRNRIYNPVEYYQKIFNFLETHPDHYLESIFDDVVHVCEMSSYNGAKDNLKKFDLKPFVGIILKSDFQYKLVDFLEMFINIRRVEGSNTLALLLLGLASSYYDRMYDPGFLEIARKNKDYAKYEALGDVVAKHKAKQQERIKNKQGRR